jgi:hypothetical protein
MDRGKKLYSYSERALFIEANEKNGLPLFIEIQGYGESVESWHEGFAIRWRKG